MVNPKAGWIHSYGLCVASALLAMASTTSYAGKMVYNPVNPSFGGNPSNGVVLLNEANAQNSFKDPASIRAASSTQQTLNERLKSRLDDAVINRITSALSRTCSTIDTTCMNLSTADYNEPVSIGAGITVTKKPPVAGGSGYDNYLIVYPNGATVETSF